jgi:short-subunit dehydrogenase
MDPLSHSIIWITGASSGIGEAFAVECVRRGARVALSARRADSLAGLVDRITTQFPDATPRARAYPADVSSLDSLQSVVTAIESEMGPIDIVVANAGINEYVSLNSFSTEKFLSVMNVNYGGLLRCIEVVLPSMRKRGKGRIVGGASIAGFRGLPTSGAYGASKSAMIHFLESIRFQLEPMGIGVTIVNPGFVKTPMTDTNEFHMPFLMECDDAVRCMADGIGRGDSEVTFPWLFSRLMKIGRILPFPLYAWIARTIWSRMEHGKE